jgi:hypothetical protein
VAVAAAAAGGVAVEAAVAVVVAVEARGGMAAAVEADGQSHHHRTWRAFRAAAARSPWQGGS